MLTSAQERALSPEEKKAYFAAISEDVKRPIQKQRDTANHKNEERAATRSKEAWARQEAITSYPPIRPWDIMASWRGEVTAEEYDVVRTRLLSELSDLNKMFVGRRPGRKEAAKMVAEYPELFQAIGAQP